METFRENALQSVRKLIGEKLVNFPVKVYLIGSSATGGANPHSDIDVVVERLDAAPDTLIMDLRVALEESDIPFFVDVFDYTRLNKLYRQKVKEEGVLWIAPEES